MTRYDTLYRQQRHALGPPTKAVWTALDRFPPPPLAVLDVGCGQGRDALPLARKGYEVHGIDPAAAGIAQMCAEAATEGLNVTGKVCDAASFASDRRFGLLLIDRTLHMIAEEAARHAALENVLRCAGPPGLVLIADERANMDGYRATLRRHDPDARPVIDKPSLLLWQLAGVR